MACVLAFHSRTARYPEEEREAALLGERDLNRLFGCNPLMLGQNGKAWVGGAALNPVLWAVWPWTGGFKPLHPQFPFCFIGVGRLQCLSTVGDPI